jgi:hypothetical protein
MIVQNLIPNRQLVQQTLIKLCEACNCKEALLFEKATFLILGHFNQE